MSIKKLNFLAALSLFTLPTAVFANLITYNYTDEFSSVKITSGYMRPCSSTVPKFGKYTPPRQSNGEPGVSNVNIDEARVICLTSPQGQCAADIYMSKDCTGPVVAKANLDLRTFSVTQLSMIDSSTYHISAEGSEIKITYR